MSKYKGEKLDNGRRTPHCSPTQVPCEHYGCSNPDTKIHNDIGMFYWLCKFIMELTD